MRPLCFWRRKGDEATTITGGGGMVMPENFSGELMVGLAVKNM